MLIKKRNGVEVEFDKDKIVSAIMKSMAETEKGENLAIAEVLATMTEIYFEDSKITPTVEDISDKVEELLAEAGRFDAAKTYILYREKRHKLRNEGWNMTDLQKDIYEQKYRFDGESFEEFLERTSGGNDEIHKLIKDKKFLPAGRILAGRGLNKKGQKVTYSNCFVIEPPEDNLESIFETAKKMARTYSFGGGCGTDLSNLRPNNAIVNNSAKQTTGACSFADLYSMTTGLIGQRNRRGALMLTMNVNHPDIVEFINLKTDLNKVTKANISVMITDDFMRAVKNDENWEMKFKVKDTDEAIIKSTKAKNIIRLLAKNNWDFAEPGALFWDKVEKWHLNSEDPTFKYVSTNPCGEKPLPKGGSCLLGSINLDRYAINSFADNAQFDFEQLDIDTRKAIKYLDEVLEEGISFLPLQEQIECVADYRQIGLIY